MKCSFKNKIINSYELKDSKKFFKNYILILLDNENWLYTYDKSLYENMFTYKYEDIKYVI